MAGKDTKTKQYTRDPVIFADAFNQFFYHGKEVVKAEELRELDSTELIYLTVSGTEVVSKQTHRDVKKYWVFMTDGRNIYCMLAIENQTKVHYAMPLKTVLYDVMHLENQRYVIEREHRRTKWQNHGESLQSGEFTSGFRKEDRLIPIITLVIYYGSEAWDGPRSLREMYVDCDEELLDHALDYKINLIDLQSMKDEELKQFRSELRHVLTCVKYYKDKEKILYYMEQDETFRSLDRSTVEAISEITNIKFKIDEGEERVDMVSAFQQIIDENVEKGREKGREEGLLEGIRSCIEICKDIGCSFENTLIKIKEKFKLEDSAAKKYMQLYW